VLLFHVHFEVPDVPAAEGEFARQGFGVKARFGYVGKEHRRFQPEEPLEGARLRLSELERGAVNVVLMPSRFPERRLGHFGVAVSPAEHAAVLERAGALGLRTKPDEVRSFVGIDRQLQLELSDGRRYSYDDERLGTLRIERIEVACADPEEAARRVDALVGPELAAKVGFVAGPERFAQLVDWSLAP
jgi:hypothetical protein